MGKDNIKEKNSYDNVGYKACIGGIYTERTSEKISKGRKALCSVSSIGIHKGEINMMSSNIIFWSIIISIITYASELWVMKLSDLDKLDEFQRFAGRKIQRFGPRSPSVTSFAGLGWLRLEHFIYA